MVQTGCVLADLGARSQKTRGDETYRAIRKELAPLREKGWLTVRRGGELTLGELGSSRCSCSTRR